jgi:NADPH:quinone reductase-like Zn-dependent oxidoreductase
MSRFKVGDRVVITEPTWRFPMGASGTFEECFPVYGQALVVFDDDPKLGRSSTIPMSILEFEEVYNSPLYKALS